MFHFPQLLGLLSEATCIFEDCGFLKLMQSFLCCCLCIYHPICKWMDEITHIFCHFLPLPKALVSILNTFLYASYSYRNSKPVTGLDCFWLQVKTPMIEWPPYNENSLISISSRRIRLKLFSQQIIYNFWSFGSFPFRLNLFELKHNESYYLFSSQC